MASPTGPAVTPVIRPAVWLFAVLLSLGYAVGSPIFEVWSASEGTGVPSLTNQTMIPVAALALVLVLAFVWNPVLGLLGHAWLRFRPVELMLTTSLLILIPGIASISLVGRWVPALTMKTDMARSHKQDDFRYGMSQALTLNSLKDLKVAASTAEEMQQQLVLPPAEQDDDLISQALETMRFYRISVDSLVPRDLTPDVILNDDEATGIAAAIASDQEVDPAIMARLDRIWANSQAEIALIEGLGTSKQKIASLVTPVVDGGPTPLSRLWSPLMVTGIIVVAGLFMVIGINTATSRQWFHHERLQHPLAQLPNAIASKSIYDSKPFKIGLLVMAVIWAYQMLGPGQLAAHPFPQLNLGKENPMIKLPGLASALGLDVAASSRWIYDDYWAVVRVFPVVVAIAFLLPTDVGFSVWGGFFFGALACAVLSTVGVPVDFNRDLRGGGMGAGAAIAMAALVVWLGRHHYWALLRAAVGTGRSEDHVGVWGTRILILGVLGFGSMVWLFSGSFTAACIAVLVTFSYLMVIARMIAECGMPTFQTSTELGDAFIALGMPTILGPGAFVVMNYLGGSLLADDRSNLSGLNAQSQAIGESHGFMSAKWVGVVVLVVLIAVVLGFASQTLSQWTSSMNVGGARQFNISDAVNSSQLTYDGLFGMSDRQEFMLLGVVLVFLVVGIRRIWMGFIFHPLGVVVGASWPIFLVWGSLMLGWLAKFLVLRYGGAGMYTNLKALALGIAIGDIIGLTAEMALLSSNPMHDEPIPSLKAWP